MIVKFAIRWASAWIKCYFFVVDKHYHFNKSDWLLSDIQKGRLVS